MWGATPWKQSMMKTDQFQSTRPVWGATRFEDEINLFGFGFQSTRPVWGATWEGGYPFQTPGISIHAPRVGRDWSLLTPQRVPIDFNPRAPCGARRLEPFVVLGTVLISIHAPRVGRDSKFDDFTPSNLHKRYKRVLARPKNTREKGKIKQKLAYIHAFSAFLGCEGSGTFCALVLRTQYR